MMLAVSSLVKQCSLVFPGPLPARTMPPPPLRPSKSCKASVVLLILIDIGRFDADRNKGQRQESLQEEDRWGGGHEFVAPDTPREVDDPVVVVVVVVFLSNVWQRFWEPNCICLAANIHFMSGADNLTSP